MNAAVKEINLFQLYDKNPEATAILTDVDKNVYNKIKEEPKTFLTGINAMLKQGLSYPLKDYYVFIQKGKKLAIQPTPRGTKKIISSLARKHGLSLVINEGVFHEGDEISLESDGQFDKFTIKKDLMNAVKKGIIVSSYAVVNVYRKNDLIARKVVYVPQDEYLKIKQMGNQQYEMMLASKVVMKRVLAGIYLLLGITVDTEDDETIAMLEEANRVDLEKEEEAQDDRYNIFFDSRDAIGMHLLFEELVQNVPDEEHDEAPYKWQKNWERFAKGTKGKMKEVESQLIEQGKSILTQLFDSLDNNHTDSIVELMEGITTEGKRILYDYVGSELTDQIKLAIK